MAQRRARQAAAPNLLQLEAELATGRWTAGGASSPASHAPPSGSHARGEAGPASDVDLLVRMAPGRDLFDLVAFKRALERLLRLPVDVVSEGGLSPWLRDR